MSKISSDVNVGPKLYTTKPKKSAAQKKAKRISTPASNPATMASAPPPPPPPPPPPVKESFLRRYKFVWPALLAVNLAIGGYLYLRTKKKDESIADEVATDVPTTPAASTTAPAPERSIPPPSVAPVPEVSTTPSVVEPVKLREPIPVDKQRELFKWILEEKRKVKTNDPEGKKRIDEEKAILKQFIRGKSIPNL